MIFQILSARFYCFLAIFRDSPLRLLTYRVILILIHFDIRLFKKLEKEREREWRESEREREKGEK